MISTILYRVQASSIALYDPFGYLLDTYTFSEPIVHVTAPSSADDLFLLVLTDTDYLYSLALHLVDPSAKKSDKSLLRELRFVGGSDASGEKRVNLREALAKKLGETLNGTVRFKQVQVQKHRGKVMVQVLDSENRLQ